MDSSDKIFIFILILALAAVIPLALGRAQIESGNRTVEIILDAEEVRQLAVVSGLTVSDVLSQFKDAGASALAVREMTVEELVEAGQYLPLATQGGISFYSSDPGSLGLLAIGISAKLPHVQGIVSSEDTPALHLPGIEMRQLAEIPVMLSPEDGLTARNAGMRLVARLGNFPNASEQAIEAAAEQAARVGARLVVFRDDQALGFPGLLKETAEAFRSRGLMFGIVELAEQKGDQALAKLLPQNLIRVHSIREGEMEIMSPAVAVTRYTRSVRERNIRACYVRLLIQPHHDALAANLEYVAGVVGSIQEEGFQIGPPGPFRAQEGWPPRWPRALVLLGIIAGFVLLVRRLAPLPPAWAWLMFFAMLLLGGAVGLSSPQMVPPIGGLAAACVFPALGTILVLQWARNAADRATARSGYTLAFAWLLAATVVSMVGGLFIVGIYSQVSHLSGIGVFTGVKLSYVVPVILTLFAVIGNIPGGIEPWGLWRIRLRVCFIEFFGRRMTVIEALLILIALGGIAFALMRSGNQSSVAPSGMELKLRNLLETLLVVRPRTKEFLLGHPALMLVAILLLQRRSDWAPLIGLLAVIGQLSVLNSFCHFHTPLWVTLLRTFHGLWIGALIGIFVIWLWHLCLHRRSRRISPT